MNISCVDTTPTDAAKLYRPALWRLPAFYAFAAGLSQTSAGQRSVITFVITLDF
jgi:hypothetical protein